MAQISFTRNLDRHVACPSCEVAGATVREALESYFAEHPRVRSYVLDEQGELRRHVVIFVDGDQIRDRVNLSEAVGERSSLYVMQALSGG